MTAISHIEHLRKKHFYLRSLPARIDIPAMGLHPAIMAKPIEDASLDELAFAANAIEHEFNELADRLHAIRKLYTLARKCGGLGSEKAIDIAFEALGETA